MFYQLLWTKICSLQKKQQQQPTKTPPGSNLGWKVDVSQTTPTGFQPNQPTIWPIRNLSDDHLPIPAAWLEIRLVGWLFFFCLKKSGKK